MMWEMDDWEVGAERVSPAELGWKVAGHRTWKSPDGELFTFAPGEPEVFLRPVLRPPSGAKLTKGKPQ